MPRLKKAKLSKAFGAKAQEKKHWASRPGPKICLKVKAKA